MRTLEKIYAEMDSWPVAAVDWPSIARELRRWTDEHTRVNVGLITENAQLRKRLGEALPVPADGPDDDRRDRPDDRALGTVSLTIQGRDQLGNVIAEFGSIEVEPTAFERMWQSSRGSTGVAPSSEGCNR